MDNYVKWCHGRVLRTRSHSPPLISSSRLHELCTLQPCFAIYLYSHIGIVKKSFIRGGEETFIHSLIYERYNGYEHTNLLLHIIYVIHAYWPLGHIHTSRYNPILCTQSAWWCASKKLDYDIEGTPLKITDNFWKDCIAWRGRTLIATPTTLEMSYDDDDKNFFIFNSSYCA